MLSTKTVESARTPRVLIVSNRLPVQTRIENGKATVTRAAGGVATGLRGVHETGDGLWIGWPGEVPHLEPPDQRELDEQLSALRTVPIYLSQDEVRGFYEDVSNQMIWPLFHYLLDRIPLEAKSWETYIAVNEKFAECVASHYREGDLIWVQDYHLTLLPALLRARLPGARIGFFLHIPFPSSEVFRTLTSRDQILRGMLGADVIGFHTHSFRRHFANALIVLLGIDPETDWLTYEGRTIELGVFPMGIDVATFDSLAHETSVLDESNAIRAQAAGRRIVLGVDRLDYTKGLPRRMLAIERFLERDPERKTHVRFVQVAVPTRENVEAYDKHRREVNELVGRINSTYGSVDSTPIHYLYQSVNPKQLVALYRAADVMLVTPLRDGMNLVAKEYIASRPDEDGVLVLSEFAGAADELVEAVRVNPYDISSMAESIALALNMSEPERKRRMRALRKRVAAFSVQDWAKRFLDTLAVGRAGALSASPGQHSGDVSSKTELDALVTRVRSAPRVLLLLDYDGTLVPFAPTPDLAVPDMELLTLLDALATAPGRSVHIVSGRAQESLEHWLGELPIGLHAEHGYWSRSKPGTLWVALRNKAENGWKREVRSIFDRFTAQTPGALLEEKTASLAWHYREAEPDLGRMRARELRQALAPLTAQLPIDILPGAKVIEVRLKGVHKGLVARSLLANSNDKYDLVLAFGDDTTDEDMFAALPPDGVAVHVGPGASSARVRIADVPGARALLGAIARS